MSDELVLVTGGSGFVGVHCILELLNAGYRVRTTVRSLKRETDVRAMLKVGGVEAGDRLSFVAADLESDAGWPEAVAGCAYVLHVASPLPASVPKHEDELIVPRCEIHVQFEDLHLVARILVQADFTEPTQGDQPDGRFHSTPFDARLIVASALTGPKFLQWHDSWTLLGPCEPSA